GSTSALPLRARIASESRGSTTGTTSTIELAAATTARSSAQVNSGRGHETCAPAPRNLPSKLRYHRRSSAVATGFGYPKPAGDCGQGGADVERQHQTESPRGDREATSGCHAPDGWGLSVATSRSARASTVTTVWCIASEMRSSKSPPYFMVLACFDSIEVMTSERRTIACSRRRAGRAAADTPRSTDMREK